eukprot:13540441-Alexandrium_andersonii.AAC.1
MPDCRILDHSRTRGDLHLASFATWTSGSSQGCAPRPPGSSTLAHRSAPCWRRVVEGQNKPLLGGSVLAAGR